MFAEEVTVRPWVTTAAGQAPTSRLPRPCPPGSRQPYLWDLHVAGVGCPTMNPAPAPGGGGRGGLCGGCVPHAGPPPSAQGFVIPGMPLIRSWCRGDASRPLASNPFPQSPCPPAPALSHTGAQETIASAGGRAAQRRGWRPTSGGIVTASPGCTGGRGSPHRRAATSRGSSARPYELQLMAAEMASPGQSSRARPV